MQIVITITQCSPLALKKFTNSMVQLFVRPSPDKFYFIV